MNKIDIDKAYISPIDKFLYAFDKAHPKSKSQIAEIKKNKRIAILRDNPHPTQPEAELWDEF